MSGVPPRSSSPEPPGDDPTAEVDRLRRELAEEREARLRAEAVVQATTRRLRRALDRLAAEQADVRSVASAAAHDVLNPLASLIGFADLLAQPELDEATRELLRQRLRGTAEHAAVLVRALAEVMRAAEDEATAEAIQLPALISGISAALIDHHPDVCVDSDVSGAVLGVPRQVQRLFGNLLDNAARHAGPLPTRVTVTVVERTDDATTVLVGDDGPGVAPRDRDRIFEIFARGAPQPDPVGRGVGLTICRRIARANGGDVWLSPDPAPGGGAAFVVRLPTHA